MEKSVSIIIPVLASQSFAMRSDTPLVLHAVCGRSMLGYAIDTASDLTDLPVVVTAGECSSSVQEHGVQAGVIHQLADDQSSAFNFLQAALHLSTDFEYLILFPANLPLVTGATLQDMIQYTDNQQLDAVLLSASQTEFMEPGHRALCVRVKWLSAFLSTHRSQLEAIPIQTLDLWSLLAAQQAKKQLFQPGRPEEIMAVTDRIILAEAEKAMRLRINRFHMENGVTLIDPAQTYIGPEVCIEQDTVIYPGNVLEGTTVIGRGCMLYPNNRLNHSQVGERVILQSSVILESSIGDESTVGPYAYIRPGSEIGSRVRIGDFVEIKKSVIGEGTKVSHLTYIGDAQLGKEINVGCGVVFVNYDGKRKQKVTVGDHAFIGCNVNLIAPVEVEQDSYIAAGSTITHKVPAKALSIARARQVNREGWVDKRKEQDS